MKAVQDLFPFGELEGLCCLRVDPLTVLEPEPFCEQMARAMRPGIRVVLFERAPWGEPSWDRCLHAALVDSRFTGIPLVAIRAIEEEQWSGIGIDWIADCSALMAEPTTVQGLRERIQRILYVPDVSELVVVDPDPANLKNTILDELCVQLDPSGSGWVYGQDEPTFRETCRQVIATSSTSWGYRPLRQHHSEWRRDGTG